MTREEWKKAYSDARKAARAMRGNAALPIGRAYWSMLQTEQFGRVIHPSIVRDRSPQSRVAEALHWAARYREAARKVRHCGFLGHLAAQHKQAARLCVQEAHEILAMRSAFRALP